MGGCIAKSSASAVCLARPPSAPSGARQRGHRRPMSAYLMPEPGRALWTEDCHWANRLCPKRMRSNQNSIGVRQAASRAACSTLAIDKRFMVSISEKASTRGATTASLASSCGVAGTVTSSRARPRPRRTDAEAATNGLALAARFATPRSRRTDPEAATNGLALAARFAAGAGLRVFLLDLRAIVFSIALRFVPLPSSRKHIQANARVGTRFRPGPK